MVLNDHLANVMSHILNSEKISKRLIIVKSSKLIKEVLRVLNEKGYIGTFEEKKSTRGDYLELNLLSKINNCGVIKPRHSIKNDEFQKFEKRFLPAKNFGVLIISTTKGLMTNEQAKEKGVGGKLIAYCY